MPHWRLQKICLTLVVASNELNMRLFLKHARCKGCIYLSIKAGLVVGTILALINHYNSIFSGTLTSTNIFQILLTYLVPYLVATFGFAMQARNTELGKNENQDKIKLLHNDNKNQLERTLAGFRTLSISDLIAWAVIGMKE